jgi:hypothetical protein
LSRQNALEVLVFGKAGFIGSFVFNSAKVTIGRAADAMVRLDDPQVSLQHATLTLDGGLFRIKDHGSRTGTRVNGAPILPRQPVEPTDELAIGPFRLRVTMCDPDEDATHAGVPEDDATMRLASLVSEISRPTAEPFFPPAVRGQNGTKGRSEPSPRSREARRPEPPPRSPVDSELGDSGETTLVRSSEAPPAYSPASSRPPAPPPTARQARGTSPTAVVPERRPPKEVFEPAPAKPAKSKSTRSSERPPPADSFGHASYAISERPATKVSPHHLDTAPEVVPVAFSLSFPNAEPGLHEDDDDDEDDSNFVPAFDLLDEVSLAGVDEETARGKSLSLEVVHSRGDRILSMEYPKVKGPLRVGGVKEALGAIEKDGTVSIYPAACRGLTVRQGDREVSPAKLGAKGPGDKMPFLAGMQANIELQEDDRVLIQWVPKAYAVDIPPLQLRPSKDGMTSGGFSLAVHIAAAMFIGLVVLGDSDRVDADINAGRFATISTKELELEPPPPPPPPPQEAPTVDNAPTIEVPVNPHDLSPKSKTKVPVNAHASDNAPPSNTPTASTQKILSSLGGASSSVSAISVTNLDALPSGVGGDFKVSGAVGKAPGDTLRIAAAGSGGKDVDTKTASELGANKMGRVQGQTSGGAVRARVTTAPNAVRGEGHLDRGEIQKVVNAHLYQIQGCYERQLAKDPSLSGKISFEWDVGLTGGVSNVRVGRSSIHSVEVTTCIQAAIQGWHFPAPQGGTVTVTYPFAFSALGG